MPRASAFVMPLVLALLPLAGVARAAAPDTTSSPREVRVFTNRALIDLGPRPRYSPEQQRTADSLGLPSPAAATLLTAAGTVAPALLLTGVAYSSNASSAAFVGSLALCVIGPGFGYYYGGVPSQALPGQALRLGSLALLGEVIILAWESDGPGYESLLGLSVLSVAIYTGATFYDLGHVGPATEQSNARRLAAVRGEVGVRPLRGGGAALALGVRF